MKAFMLLGLLSLMSTIGFSHDNIPPEVKVTFSKLFPEVHKADVYWEARKEAVVATFNEEGDFKKAFFAENGEWLETRIRLYPGGLPLPVSQYVKRHHSDVDVTFLGKVLLPEGYLYRIEWETFEEVVIELLNKEGELVEKRTIPFTEGMELY